LSCLMQFFTLRQTDNTMSGRQSGWLLNISLSMPGQAGTRAALGARLAQNRGLLYKYAQRGPWSP
jgi:hypothetical protein